MCAVRTILTASFSLPPVSHQCLPLAEPDRKAGRQRGLGNVVPCDLEQAHGWHKWWKRPAQSCYPGKMGTLIIAWPYPYLWHSPPKSKVNQNVWEILVFQYLFLHLKIWEHSKGKRKQGRKCTKWMYKDWDEQVPTGITLVSGPQTELSNGASSSPENKVPFNRKTQYLLGMLY